MSGTFEIIYTNATCAHTERIRASSLRDVLVYAGKEAKALGAEFSVEEVELPKYTKTKMVDKV